MKTIKRLFTNLMRSYYYKKICNMTYSQYCNYLIETPNPSYWYLDFLLGYYPLPSWSLRNYILRKPKVPENIILLIKSYDKFEELIRK